MKAATFLALGLILGIVIEKVIPASPRHAHGAERLLRAPCIKCGSEKIKISYCFQECLTLCPTLPVAKVASENLRRGPIVWVMREHLHRECRECGFSNDAMECLDKDWP